MMMMMMMMIMIIIIIIMSTIPKNKPDITIPGNGEGTRMLVDTAISVERNVIKKESEKILKHEDVAKETQRMCNVETKVIPVTTGATGTI
jgi:competence protein ComGC